MTFDGKLDDGFWDGLPTYQLWDLETGKSPVANRTTFKVTSTPNTLYFGIHCTETDMAGLHVAGTKHDDSAIWNGDNVELLFETTAHAYYQIAINPSGHFVDADRKERIETRWNSGAQVATHTGDGFWSVEVKLPLAGDQQSDIDPLHGIAGRLPNKTFRWPINIGRQRIRGDQIEHSAFALSKTDKTSFHDRLTWGELFVP